GELRRTCGCLPPRIPSRRGEIGRAGLVLAQNDGGVAAPTASRRSRAWCCCAPPRPFVLSLSKHQLQLLFTANLPSPASSNRAPCTWRSCCGRWSGGGLRRRRRRG